ncbi:MAG: hypothetical protein K0R03_1337 [Moraxellaceae bacterium]|jgi:hypothetical protein|nr:hypothetical protein [Moraxellaceae bacterium]
MTPSRPAVFSNPPGIIARLVDELLAAYAQTK